MRDDERLRPIVDEFGGEAVWFEFIELFGFPPTWQPSLKQLIELKTHLSKERAR